MRANITIYTTTFPEVSGRVCLLNVALKADLYHLVTILSPLQREHVIVPATRAGSQQGCAL